MTAWFDVAAANIEKLKGGDISAEMSRLIMQTFFIAIILDITTEEVYKIVLTVCMKDNKFINPIFILQKNIPTRDIQENMKKVLDRPLESKYVYMREKWELLLTPRVNISNLLQHFEKNADTRAAISDIYKRYPSYSINKITPIFHKELKNKLTKKEIEDLLTYKN
jgi:hypothetical protein